MWAEDFEIVAPLEAVEVIARGLRVRVRQQLSRRYGKGTWRKLKAVTFVRLEGGDIRRAEVHWYEAHGVGKVGWKIKTFLD